MTTNTLSALLARTWMRAGAILLAALAALVAFAPGCGDQHATRPFSPAAPATAPARATPAALLTDYFETAYSNRDSVLYEAMLDDEYRFEFLPDDAMRLRDPLNGNTSWGKADELASAGKMFRAPEITRITLDIEIESETDYLGEDCVACRQVETWVALRVVTQKDDNVEPLAYTVDSPQTFVVKQRGPDEQWVLYRQIDRPSALPRPAATPGGGAAPAKGSRADEEHDEIKDLYR
ncbi:MAG: hypothetical protein ACKVU1_15430 [bacterium]